MMFKCLCLKLFYALHNKVIIIVMSILLEQNWCEIGTKEFWTWVVGMAHAPGMYR